LNVLFLDGEIMNKFAFIVHPIEIQDFYGKFPMLKRVPRMLAHQIMDVLPPFKLTTMVGKKANEVEIEGYLIGVPIGYSNLLEKTGERTGRRIIRACRLAEKLGAKLIGIGSYLSDIVGMDSDMMGEIKTPITTGKHLGILALIEAAKTAAEWKGRKFKESDIIVLGIEHPLGSVLSRKIAREAKYLTLISRERNSLEVLSKTILEESGTAVHVSHKVQSSIERGEVIFILDWKDGGVDWTKLRKNAILCDLSRFRKASLEIKSLREDILCLDDGFIKLPWTIETQAEYNVEISKNTCSSALAETILLSLESHLDSISLRDGPTMDSIHQMHQWAENYSYQLAGIRHLKEEIPIL